MFKILSNSYKILKKWPKTLKKVSQQDAHPIRPFEGALLHLKSMQCGFWEEKKSWLRKIETVQRVDTLFKMFARYIHNSYGVYLTYILMCSNDVYLVGAVAAAVASTLTTENVYLHFVGFCKYWIYIYTTSQQTGYLPTSCFCCRHKTEVVCIQDSHLGICYTRLAK